MELTKQYSLSDDVIRNAFNGRVKIIRYSDIKHYRSAEELLAPYGRTVILWVKSYKNPNYGHWTCIFRSPGGPNVIPGTIFYFDSYGTTLEGVLRNVDKKTKDVLSEHDGYLRRMFINDDVYYNKNQLQRRGKNICTCGRHCITRMVFDNLSNDEYAKFLKSFGRNTDDTVTNATNALLFS